MFLTTSEPVHLIRVNKKSFINKNGQPVEYYEAKFFDGEEIVTTGVDPSTAIPLIDQDDIKGVASFSTTPAGDKTKAIKLRMMDFDRVTK